MSPSEQSAPTPADYTVTRLDLDATEQHTILLALAKLATDRPGWAYHCERIAKKIAPGPGAEVVYPAFLHLGQKDLQ